ncbi:MAG TPA: alpha/beta fold hydrolase [Gaiellaceae bacterium]|nr:alpha/beta fold hydrolase [Gaiellaceae bacterium]
MTLPRLIPVEEFYADPEFSGASISPDGTRLAYLAPAHGHLNLWVRAIDEEHEDAVCVTHNERRNIKTYYWTNDPRWLLYRQDTDGNEDWHLYRVDLENPDAPAVDLTPLPPGGRVTGVSLVTSDPGSLLVTMNVRPLFFDLFRVDLASGETALVREQEGYFSSYLGHEGAANFYSAQADDDGAYEFFAVDEDTGEKRLVYRAGGAEHPVGPYPLVPTPDGRALLLGVFGDGDDLCLVRVGHDGEQSVVAAVPGRSLCTIGMFTEDFGYPPSPYFSRRTGEAIAARFVGDRPTVEVVDPAYADVFGALSALSDGVLGWISSDEQERRWVVTFIHDRKPGETFFYDHATGESRPLFRGRPTIAPEELAPMTPVSFPARDGLPLHGFLTLPVGVEPANLPLVLFVHGGPWFHDAWGFDSDVQFLANRGYAVLQVNFRGSTGYGKRHLTAGIGEFARKMHDDLIDACEWAVARGYADRDRIGIYGGSYGGYSALVGVTVTPDYFAAAVDWCGISSWPNCLRTMPEFVRPMLRNNFHVYLGDPDDPVQEADLLARSPITMVDRIRTPLLVIQGGQDARVVQAEADNLVEALRARGVEVGYVLAPDEGHDTFQGFENRVAMYRAIESHFATHLGGRA